MGVDATNSDAIKKLFALKQRSLSKPVPVLIPNRRILHKYCSKISKTAETLMEKFWPGALTIILESDTFSEGVSKDGKVGFRISAHPFAQAILSYFGGAITATSANLSDKPSPSNPDEFFKIFPKDSFMLIQDGEKTKPSQPSTVVDCSGESYKIIREGAVSEEKIKKALQP